MMAAEMIRTGLKDRLPEVRGRIDFDAPLGPLTWFRVGGPADVLFRPADARDLADFLSNLPDDVPVTVIGVGSNLLIRDGGVRGVVIRLGKAFGQISVDGNRLHVGAGATDVSVAAAARDAGIAGLEFLRGIPGTIGGALRMNAGAYGREVANVLVEAEAVDRVGQLHRLSLEDMGFSYRRSRVPADWIITGATLAGSPDAPEAIAQRMAEINEAREESQPLRTRTGGSTFKNPTSDVADGRRAWELIDAAGCRGFAMGGAQVSEKHCNFLINTGTATADDLEALGEEVRRRVHAATGVTLDWEIRIIGDKAGDLPSDQEVQS
jgi:UDP-N-acetylmuramate dehydrogenase